MKFVQVTTEKMRRWGAEAKAYCDEREKLGFHIPSIIVAIVISAIPLKAALIKVLGLVVTAVSAAVQ